jgi:arylsulfatase A-like enzyme
LPRAAELGVKADPSHDEIRIGGEGKGDMGLILKGVLLGLLTACVTTIGDDLISLNHSYNFAIPQSYPFVLIAVNACVWGSLGCLSGALVLYLRSKVAQSSFSRYEDLIWTLCYVGPFLVLYTVLSSLYFEPWTLRWTARDSSLSIAWILLLLGILTILTRTRVRRGRSSPIAFLPELSMVVSMLCFCGNLDAQLHFKLRQTFGLPGGKSAYYCYGAFFFASTYLLALLASLSCKRTVVVRNWALFVMLLLSLPLAALSTFRVWQHTLPIFHIAERAQKQARDSKLSPIILIVVDTARADRFSTYGYPKETSPTLDRFAKDTLIFENCYASAPSTVPSHASLFTALYPLEHGAHYVEAGSRKSDTFLPDSPAPMYGAVPNLIELLKDNGYVTGAIVSNTFLRPDYGFGRGFDYYNASRNIGRIRSYFRPIAHIVCLATSSFHETFMPYRVASQINAEVFAWLEKFSKKPFFLFINYMDPHDSYFPPSPFDSLFGEEGRIHIHRFVPALKRHLGLMGRREYLRYLGTQYDGEIAYVDRELGRLFEKIRGLGIYESSLIVVTSDHGEFLGEHSLRWHGTYMYEEVLRVPLLIKFPFSSRTGVEANPIQMVDIGPTIFDILRLPLPGDLSGTPYGDPEKPIVGEFFKSTLGVGVHRVLYQGKHKLMHYTQSRNSELYDLGEDPGETRDLSKEKERAVLKLSDRLSEWQTKHPPREKRESADVKVPSQEVLEDLRALGYIK